MLVKDEQTDFMILEGKFMKPMRMHHVGIVLPEKSYAQDLIDMFGLEVVLHRICKRIFCRPDFHKVR